MNTNRFHIPMLPATALGWDEQDNLVNIYYEPVFSVDFGAISKHSNYGAISVDFFHGEIRCFLETNETGIPDLIVKMQAIPTEY